MLGQGLVCFSVSIDDPPLLSVICVEEEFSVTEESSAAAAVVVVGGSGCALTSSGRAEVCLFDGDEAGSVDGPAGVLPSSGSSLLDIEEGSQPPPSSRLAVVSATTIFGVSTSFELSDSLDFLVPSRFSRVVSVIDRSDIDVGGGNGTARLAGARRGTGGATCSGAGEPVLEGKNGDEGRPDAGDPARERLNDIGEATD